jgi:hypothetical protein
MRRTLSLALLSLALVSGSALKAQEPHFGVSFNLLFPTGSFNNKNYPAYFDAAANRTIPAQKEGYDVGLGGQFTVSFPVERALAIRLNVGGTVTDGRNTAPGERTINLRHSVFNLGADLQLFPSAGAFRHKGFYFLGGLSADFERFERTFGNFDTSYYGSYYYDPVDTTRKSRMGGNLGIGNSFGFDSGRFTLELVYHKTLTGKGDTDPIPTDHVKLGIGWVF